MSHSILLNGLTSPVRASAMRHAPRSILRRTAAMPMSPNPFPFQANFSVLLSPTVKSPHVQFMASPQLVATFAAFSPETYDRAPIKVSPSPMNQLTRGERLLSPTMATFKLAAAPKPKASVLKRLQSIARAAPQCASPAITEFEDPRSPKQAVAAKQPIQSILSFAAARVPQPLTQALASYPRSPYPSATEFSGRAAEEVGEPFSRARSLSDSTAPARLGKPVASLAAFTPSLASPLKQSFKPPTTAGLQRSHKPTPLSLEPQDDASALSDAFWDVVSLGGETPMVTAPEYPGSAVDSMMEDIDLRSPQAPALVFGNSNGEVWSPTVPASKPPAREFLLRSALLSPGKAAFGRAKRSVIASPSPNDPFAAFPSFAAALSMGPGSIAYPAPVMSYC